MKGPTVYSCLLLGLCLVSFFVRSQAQIITAGSSSINSLCAGSGGTGTVSFTTSGTFVNTNNFSAQLSDAAGIFSASPPAIGVSKTSPIPITLSSALPVGSGYKIRVVSSNTAVAGSTSPTVLTVKPLPAGPVATTPPSYCEGDPNPAPLVATASPGGILNWYSTNQNGGVASGKPNIPDTNVPVNTAYYVSQTVNGCEGSRTAIAVTVLATPAKPIVAGPPPVCSGSPVGSLSATASQGNTLHWWGENQQGGSPSSTPSTVSNTRSATYYVSQVSNVGGCDSPRTPISVQIKPIPGAPTAPDPGVFCLNRPTRKLTATATEPNAALSWYDAGDKLLSGAPEPPTSATGVTTYYVRQTLDGCLSTDRKTIQVTVNKTPDLPTVSKQADLCEGTLNKALSAAGTALKWYDDNLTGGTASASASIVKTTGSYVGKTTNYYVTQTQNGCESDRATIPVRVKDTPDKPGTTSVDFCQGAQPPTLTVALTANASPNWFGTDATGGTASATPPVLGNSLVGTTVYYVSQTLDGCPGPRASLNVRVKPLPGQPGVSPAAFCNNQPIEPLRANGERLKWYDVTENLIGTNAPSPATNTVGDQFYKVSQTNGDGCEGPKATLKVTIKPLPGQPSVANLSFCQAQADQPAQNVPVLTAGGQNLRWYNPDGNPFPNAPKPAIDQAGVQTYQVSQTVDNCEGGRATLQVTVNTIAAPTVAKSLVSYCINEKASPLQATIAPGATAQWRDPYDRLTTDAPTPSTLNTNIDPAGDRFFVYQIGSNGCFSARSTIRVVVNTTPTLSLVAPITDVNLGLKVPLKLTFTGSAPYSYTISGGYTGTSRTNDTTIAVLPRGNTTYQVTAVTNGCGIGLPGNPATAAVTVRVPTVATGPLASSTLCAGTSLTVPFTTTGQFNPGNSFRFELVSTTDTSKKYDIPATAGTSPITATLPLTIPGGQYAVRVKALNPEVGITGTSSPTPLTVRSLPSATLTGTQSIYEGTPANLTITFGGDGPWALTYADSVRSYSVVTAVNPFVAEVRPARTITYRITSLTNSCGTGPMSGTANVSVLPLLGVDDNSLDPLVTAYPVPTGRSLTVELDLPLTRNPAELSLMDMQGRPVLQHTTRSRRTELDLSAQPSGFYILRIRVGDRHTVRKVIKL